MASILNATTTSGLVTSADNSGSLQLQTNNGTTAVTIDTSQNVGIGTSRPSDTSLFTRALDLNGTSGAAYYARTNGSSTNYTVFGNFGSDGYINNRASGNLLFYNSNTERMRITSVGDVLVGTSTVGMANGGIQSQPNGNTTNVPFFGCAGNSSSSSHLSYGLYSTSLSQYQFYVGYNGTIAARSTSITGLSDISEKENIQPLETGLNEVLALQPRRFDWKNGSGQNVAGFVAQEVEDVLPDLVEEYRVNEETTKKGLKMGDMIPTLVKAIQELKAELDEAKAEIAALKGAK
jgi:hypothetical protein